TSKNPFRRLPAQLPPDCVKPPRNAESIASSAFLARQKLCSESVQNRFLYYSQIKGSIKLSLKTRSSLKNESLHFIGFYY
ncbi:MAG: hypothetical protein PHP68_07385, partial [Oscillospiraceae bacterium]|nr:hypothetical protein [Oscillospiraceae bacterium]